MKLIAPDYYPDFACIAGACGHSCCVGWEIDIDEHTLKRYKRLKDGYGAVIAGSIAMDDTPHFRLGSHDRCPHLDERGLCRIILNVGEDYLCDICREHPRFYNFTSPQTARFGLTALKLRARRPFTNSAEMHRWFSKTPIHRLTRV